MNKFELWFLQRIIKKAIKQGNHHHKIFNLYKMITDAAREEFSEDSKQTFDHFLNEIHQDSLRNTK